MSKKIIHIRIFSIVFSIWLIVSVVFGKHNSANDGYNEIGVPFTFYRSYSGKTISNYQSIQLSWYGLTSDILIVLIVIVVISRFRE